MKIITKDNYSRDLFTERVIAENVSGYFGQQLVDEWNERYWTEHSDFYLLLVEDNYKLYDGYAELI
jgi:hypothetical protein